MKTTIRRLVTTLTISAGLIAAAADVAAASPKSANHCEPLRTTR